MRRLFLEGWNEGRFEFLSNRTADVLPMQDNGNRLGVTAESLPGLVGIWRSGFPDLRFEIRHLVCEGDLVAVSLVLHGTHQGDWWGIPATGHAVGVEEMMFFRFEHGVLTEMWELTLRRTDAEAPDRPRIARFRHRSREVRLSS